jgi:hypothetical protein
MKKAIWIGIFIFSLALNLAVAATLGRHLWLQQRSSTTGETGGAVLTSDDVRQIKKICMEHNGAAITAARNKILEKNFQLLDLIARDPTDTVAVEQSVSELIELKRGTEKAAISRISSVMASLPPQKRQAFAVFLKNRSCMMSGMGACPMRLPMGQESSR